MKKIFSLIVFLASVMMAYAQSSNVATLRKSDGTVSVFYGANAFVDAHAAAETKGSIINLSSGVFYGTIITKNITLRGAGMEKDTLTNREPTLIVNDFGINETDSVIIEGICYHGTFRYGCDYDTKTVRNMTFLKSHIGGIQFGYNDDKKLVNAFFVNCRISGQLDLTSGSSVVCVNSVIANPYVSSTTSSLFGFHNCVIKYVKKDNTVGWDECGKLYNAHINNCLIFTNEAMDVSNIVSNSLGFGNADIFTNNTLSTCTYISDATTVFKTYTGGDIIDGETFELTEEAKSKYLGDDGTQVGIYGGFYPYNPTTTAPQIKKFDVARKTTADGKLEVDIEVIATAGGN